MKLTPEESEARLELEYKIIAQRRQEMAEGACVHGKIDNGFDMERACLACEDGDYPSLYEIAFQEATHAIRVKRQEEALKKIRLITSEEFNFSIPSQIAIIKKAIAQIEA